MQIVKKFINNFKINNKKEFIIENYNKNIYNICLILYNKKYINNIFWFININNKIYLLIFINNNKKINKVIFYKKNNYKIKENFNVFLNIYLTNFGIFSGNIVKLLKIKGKIFCTII